MPLPIPDVTSTATRGFAQHFFCKGSLLRNEPQYPRRGMLYTAAEGGGGSDSEDEKRGG